MNKLTSPAAPAPAMDLAGYNTVTIVKTDVVDGHTYRRGQKVTADAATLAALRDKGMVAAAAASGGNQGGDQAK